MVNPKSEIGLFLFYLQSLNLAMFNVLTYLNKPTYLIRFNKYPPTWATRVNILLVKKIGQLKFH
jgi:hypothetical protein